MRPAPTVTRSSTERGTGALPCAAPRISSPRVSSAATMGCLLLWAVCCRPGSNRGLSPVIPRGDGLDKEVWPIPALMAGAFEGTAL
ncbi:hypothetical protein GCM10010303_25540 [Streptomyces purpurascens]|nr:hypothetical protein GCM10010303_25540 [Streptomyces purpurascens]